MTGEEELGVETGQHLAHIEQVGLLLLPPEMVVMVSNYLNLSSTLALASSSNSLSSTFTSVDEWTTILNKMANFQKRPVVREKNEEEVIELANFLRTVEEPDQLLDLLLHSICRQHLATGLAAGSTAVHRHVTRCTVTIACSLHHHQVSLHGIHLLHLATSTMSAVPWIVREVVMYGCPNVSEVSTLVSLVREQQEEVASLQVDFLSCNTREELGAWMDLLEKCAAWQVGTLRLLVKGLGEKWDELGKFWSRLAAGMGRGKVTHGVMMTRKVMAAAEAQDLRKVWEATGQDWVVINSRVRWNEGGWRRVIARAERLEEGWEVLEELMEKEQEAGRESEEDDSGDS